MTVEGRAVKAVAVLQRQLTAVTTLLNDLADAAAVAQDSPRLKKERVVVQDALEDAANSVRESVVRNRQELVVTIPAAPFSVDADPGRLQQILLNLLGNASKYTPAGGHIHLTATVEANEAVIRVTDDGIGISHDVLPRIFDLFTRGDVSNATTGLGVGLAVVRELAVLHGGGVEARSPGKGKGSVFTLRLPLSREHPSKRATIHPN